MTHNDVNSEQYTLISSHKQATKTVSTILEFQEQNNHKEEQQFSTLQGPKFILTMSFH